MRRRVMGRVCGVCLVSGAFAGLRARRVDVCVDFVWIYYRARVCAGVVKV
jgi:hypothetical protein